jgi:hypothetical protein
MTVQTIDAPYFIESKPEKNTVEVWSSARLPFEPKGWLLQLRNEMKSAIRSMPTSDNTGFYAVYTSADNHFFDIENVLLYNIGTGAFSQLCRYSLCFERKVAEAPVCHLNNQFMPYHYLYKTINCENRFRCWKEKNCLAKWDDIIIPSLKNENKPHAFWNAMKTGMVEVLAQYDGTSLLGLDLKIKSPKDQKVNLAAAIKSLVDGIISSFHMQDGLPDSKATVRLAELLNNTPEAITEMLCNTRLAVLGKRKLIHPFMDGIQWNPADDCCMAVRVVLEDCLDGEDWFISGKLFTVSETVKMLLSSKNPQFAFNSVL